MREWLFLILDNVREHSVCVLCLCCSLVVGGLRGGFCEKLLEASTLREEWENVGETAVQAPRPGKEGEEVRIPLQPHCFSLPYSDLLGHKLSPLPKPVLTEAATGEWGLPVQTLTHEPSTLFPLPVQLRSGYINPQQSATN